MEYFATLIVVLPILLRTLWASKSQRSIFIYRTTFFTYSIWTFLFLYLVIFQASVKSILIIFAFFPCGLILYELYNLSRFWKKINFSFRFNFMLGFLLLNVIINLFTFKNFADSGTYLRFGHEAYYTNSVSAVPGIYHFTSFYIVANIFGPYLSQFFYSVFVPLFMSLAFFYAVDDLIFLEFPQLYQKKILYAFLAIVLAFFINSSYSVDTNKTMGMLVGFLMLIFLCHKLNRTAHFEEKDYWFYSLSIIFYTIFSNSALVTGVFLWTVVALLIWVFRKSDMRFIFSAFLLIAIVILIELSNKGYQKNLYPAIVLTTCLIFFASVFKLPKKFFQSSFYQKSGSEWTKWSQSQLQKKNFSKKIVFISVNLVSLIIFSLAIFVFAFQINNNLTIMQAGFNFIYLIFILVVVNLLFLNRHAFLAYWLGILGTMFVTYFVIVKINFVGIDYLTSRSSYVFYFCISLFFIVLISELVYSKPRFLAATALPILASFSFVNPETIVRPIFSGNVRQNNALLSKNDFNFFYKNENKLINKKVFSDQGSSFLTGIWNNGASLLRNYYYFREFPNANSIQFSSSIFDKISPYDDFYHPDPKEIQQVTLEIENRIAAGNYFDVLLLHNDNSSLNKLAKNHYQKFAGNQNFTIWLNE